MTEIILVLIWAGAAYRVHMALRRRARHRTLLAVSALGMAAATTLYLGREGLDNWLGVPNVSLLLMRVVGMCAGMTGLLYLQDVRGDGPSIPAIQRTAAASIVTVVIAWIFAPLHQEQLHDIATLPLGWATVYGAVLYFYGAFVFAVCTKVAIAHVRETRHTDPAGAVSTSLIALASVVAIVIIVLFLGNLVAGRPWLHALRTTLVPLPAVLMILGWVAIPLVAPLIRWIAASTTIRRTERLWSALVSRHPEVRLPLPASTHFSRPLRAERKLIEIADSLEHHTIEPARSLLELAQAVTNPPVPGGESARIALMRLDRAPWPRPVLHLADAVSTLKASHP